LGAWLQSLGRATIPELTVVCKHGLGVLSALIVESLIHGFLRLGFLPAGLNTTIDRVLYWGAVALVIIFCTQAAGHLMLNVYEETLSRWQIIQERRRSRISGLEGGRSL
jgi:hypothetical protein